MQRFMYCYPHFFAFIKDSRRSPHLWSDLLSYIFTVHDRSLRSVIQTLLFFFYKKRGFVKAILHTIICRYMQRKRNIKQVRLYKLMIWLFKAFLSDKRVIKRV